MSVFVRFPGALRQTLVLIPQLTDRSYCHCHAWLQTQSHSRSLYVPLPPGILFPPQVANYYLRPLLDWGGEEDSGGKSRPSSKTISVPEVQLDPSSSCGHAPWASEILLERIFPTDEP